MEKGEYISDQLQRLERGKQRIIVSSMDYESEDITKIAQRYTNVESENREVLLDILAYIRAFQGDCLFIRYETILKVVEPDRAMDMLLSRLADNESAFVLYLFVPEESVERTERILDKVYTYKKDWPKYFSKRDTDDGYLIKIEDYRERAISGYAKIYPDGKGVLETENDYRFKETFFELEKKLLKELTEEVQRKVEKRLAEDLRMFIDDRCDMRSLVVTYGFAWLGKQHSWDVDCNDYFHLQHPYPLESIGKVMNIPRLQEHFVRR